MESLKENAKKIGLWLISRFFYFIGMFLFTLCIVIWDTLKGIVNFFIAGFFLYISVGIVALVLCFLLSGICHALLGH